MIEGAGMTRDGRELIDVLEKIATRLDWIADSLQSIKSGDAVIHVVTRNDADEIPYEYEE